MAAIVGLVAGGGRISPDNQRKSAHERRESQLVQVARRQHSVVSRDQLMRMGLRQRTIDDRVNRGRLHRVHRGVYCLFPPPHTVHQHWMAAVLACGGGSALCGPSAAALQDIADLPGLPAHVRSASRTGRDRAGLVVHRGAIDPRDLRIVNGIRAVSADVVLVDLAPELDESELEVVLVAAESKGLVKRGRLGELVAARRGRPGMPKLERLLALEPEIARSGLEVLMLPVARLAGLERPRMNFPVAVPDRDRPLVVDFAWPGLGMVVEADSQRFHGDWERASADRERDQLLALAGWRCHRFVRDRFAEPEWMAARLAALAAAATSTC
ncbi:MAG: type IV toxin-antitoxin system AbiEi family antitoxin domain-containing protein [Solirubrobacterales bacterium]